MGGFASIERRRSPRSSWTRSATACAGCGTTTCPTPTETSPRPERSTSSAARAERGIRAVDGVICRDALGKEAALTATAVRDRRGVYTAVRASALSGVPLSTVHYWARKEILVPGISAERTKLWSYVDLMGLRIIYWLRQDKPGDDEGSPTIPRTKMTAIRQALRNLDELDLSLWGEGSPTVAVERSGRLVIETSPAEDISRQRFIDQDMLDVVVPFQTARSKGPDLSRPRPHLRIVPGKLSGAPHIEDTRVETIALAALAERGLASAKIYALYPIASPEEIDEALDLERQLAANLQAAA
jgi:uncharacterized protein (DUF433 family)